MCPAAINCLVWCPFPGISPGAEGNMHCGTSLRVSLSKVITAALGEWAALSQSRMQPTNGS